MEFCRPGNWNLEYKLSFLILLTGNLVSKFIFEIKCPVPWCKINLWSIGTFVVCNRKMPDSVFGKLVHCATKISKKKKKKKRKFVDKLLNTPQHKNYKEPACAYVRINKSPQNYYFGTCHLSLWICYISLKKKSKFYFWMPFFILLFLLIFFGVP